MKNENWSKEKVFDIQKDIARVFDIGMSKHVDNNGEKCFVVLNLTDIHYSHDRKNLSKSLRLIRNLIQETNPDLITLTGDQISFYEDKEKYLTELCNFMDGFDIPWAPILGNHEGFSEEQRLDIGKFYCEKGYKNIIFRMNDKKLGVGNYIIAITREEKIIHSIFMVDSHTDREYLTGIKDYDYIWDAQFDWYRWAYLGMEKYTGDMALSSCFLHIPLSEYKYAYDEYKHGYLVGKNDNNEPICCPWHKRKGGPFNNGFFDLIQKCGTKLVLCGHDHTNTADIMYHGVELAYSMCTRRGRFCNGYRPAGTTVCINEKGHYVLRNYVEKSFGKVKEVKNIGKRYTFMKKMRDLFSED